LILDLLRHAIAVALLSTGPLLITALVVGVVISLLQAVTQIQEQTVSFVPKLLAVALVGLLTLPWMLQQLVQYLTETLRSLPTVAP
jgi:flagellar biosynthetic protein FliQ